MKTELREDQKKAILQLKQSIIKGNKRIMIQAPTGFGKTVLASAIVEGAFNKGNRIIFVVPAISLINQTAEKFHYEGITEIGILQADHPLTDYSKPIQIASVQTLGRRRIPEADIVVIDEAHIWYQTYKKWMGDWDAVPFIGLSATPWTRGLGKFYDDLIIASTTEIEIEKGHLCDFEAFAPSHPDLTGVKTVAGDYHEGQLSEAMQKGTLVADIVTTWLEKAENMPTLVFAVDRAHAKKLVHQFTEKGISTGYIDAYTTTEERDEIKKQFHDGDIKVVCNVGCLIMGIDWDVRCIVLARPTKSEMRFVQMVGRGLRTAEGKEHCLILDHSDTHLRLGMVTDINHKTLDSGKPKKKQDSKPKEKPLPKDCAKCGYLKPAKTHECPNCGFKPEKQPTVEVVDGELTKLQRKRNREVSNEEKEYFFGELKWYARSKGYSLGWASHKYKERFGVWPNSYKDAVEIEPTQGTKNWIRSRQIAWANSKDNPNRIKKKAHG